MKLLQLKTVKQIVRKASKSAFLIHEAKSRVRNSEPKMLNLSHTSSNNRDFNPKFMYFFSQ